MTTNPIPAPSRHIYQPTELLARYFVESVQRPSGVRLVAYSTAARVLGAVFGYTFEVMDGIVRDASAEIGANMDAEFYVPTLAAMVASRLTHSAA